MFDWIVGLIHASREWGVFLLMTVENVFPPIPSELIMPMAGFEASRGTMSFAGVVAAGTAGSIIGAVAWYWVGRWLGLEALSRWAARHGRWLTMTPEQLTRADAWFRRHGDPAVFIGRTLPGVRGVIAIPAGVSGMKFTSFLLWSSLGSLCWCVLLTGAGFALRARYAQVERWLNPVTTVFMVVCVVIYLYRVVTFRAAPREDAPSRGSAQ